MLGLHILENGWLGGDRSILRRLLLFVILLNRPKSLKQG
jgi:hypothetical protein